MITVNTYSVTAQTVYAGVSNGVAELLKDVNNFSKPDVVVDTISQSVMNHLCEVLDFGVQPIRFTPDQLLKIAKSMQENTPSPTTQSD